MAPTRASKIHLAQLHDAPQDTESVLGFAGLHDELVPVQLPEAPAAPSRPSTGEQKPYNAPRRTIYDSGPSSRGPRRVASTSPVQGGQRSGLPLESPGSPRSDLSRNSEESVIIVGDMYSAPVHLRFSTDHSPNMRDAGALNRYSTTIQHSPAPSLDNSPSLRTEEPLQWEGSRSSCPSIQRPSSSILESNFVSSTLDFRYSPKIIISAPSSKQRQMLNGPRALNVPREDPESPKATRHWKKRRKEEMEKMRMQSQGHDVVEPPLDAQESVTTEATFPATGLNPMAASFQPPSTLIDRARSLPGISFPARGQPFGSGLPPGVPNETFPLRLSQTVAEQHRQETTHLYERDATHLRQWSDLFYIQPANSPDPRQRPPRFHGPSSPLGTSHTEFPPLRQINSFPGTFNLSAVPPRDGFGTLKGMSQSPSNMPKDLQDQIYPLPTYFDYQSYEMEARRASLADSQLSENSKGSSSTSGVATPVHTPVDLPSHPFIHQLTEIKLPESNLIMEHMPDMLKRMSLHGEQPKPAAVPTVPPKKAGKRKEEIRRDAAQTPTRPAGLPPTPRKSKGASLAARGKTSLTPVTERSEISTPNVSGSLNHQPSVKDLAPKRNKRATRKTKKTRETAQDPSGD